jgi:hypothetical protein
MYFAHNRIVFHVDKIRFGSSDEVSCFATKLLDVISISRSARLCDWMIKHSL